MQKVTPACAPLSFSLAFLLKVHSLIVSVFVSLSCACARRQLGFGCTIVAILTVRYPQRALPWRPEGDAEHCKEDGTDKDCTTNT
ncbi:hypothetical protein TNCV_1091461 [Trichonephila clavipes]|nr:hypothetical protein TNCV_1091461 [Trichonephila clavipes]